MLTAAAIGTIGSILLQGCGVLGDATRDAGFELPAMGVGVEPIDHDRLDRQIAALQCTPASVHEQLEAEHESLRAVATDRQVRLDAMAITVTDLRTDLAEARSQAESAVGSHAAALHAEQAEHAATRAQLQDAVDAATMAADMIAVLLAHAPADRLAAVWQHLGVDPPADDAAPVDKGAPAPAP